ncbi:ABC transporter ATP-binding protein [Lysinibacillus odysseyi]|uniref:ABC transporter n=1 Tax=Lysinibacillus odysseyi 34hs-1 = NBRC 100172 TaxID=1220589 RepID=A0A0A3INV5_9BACI|nr:ABC transporter ATP-binding protein [Lysinibacillus odysseyi]KGR86469.1 ABC transporter [Lysinibacillus odysseyi 34hs-1 = NBRC 100172]
MPAISIRNLQKSFPAFTLKNVSFDVQKGTIMGFIGENGAGKSTTIKCILNVLKKDSGLIKIFGYDHTKEEMQIKEEIGVVYDDLPFPETLTGSEIEKFMSRLYKNWDEPLFYQLLKQFKINPAKKVKELSRGMKMKLSIAIALAHHPKLLILDEPTSGLDPIVRDEILDLFLHFMEEEEHTILFSSHITSDLEKIADSITFIHEGEIVFSESKDVLLYEYAIWKGSQQELKDLPEDAIVRMRQGIYGVEALVRKNRIHSIFPTTRPTIEELMVFLTKGDI